MNDIHLSKNEEAVLEQIMRGLSVRETAVLLNLGESTVKNYRSRIVEKMCSSNIIRAVLVYLYEKGMLSKLP